jgi:hypothetical protein
MIDLVGKRAREEYYVKKCSINEITSEFRSWKDFYLMVRRLAVEHYERTGKMGVDSLREGYTKREY